jgi:ATP-dependent RNA helicase DDX21
VVANIEGLRLDEDEFQVLGIYGGDPISRQSSRLSRGVDIVVATPGRMIDMLDRGFISLGSIQVVCLDEADEMLKQGFQESIVTIFSKIKKQRKESIQTLLFSATFPEWVNTLSAKYQSSDTEMIDLVPKEGETPSTITHYLIDSSGSSPAQLVQKLISHFTSKDGRAIIFCETKRLVNDMSEDLGDGCGMLHGDVRQQDREKVYREFKAGRITVVVATNVAARGLDFPDIQLVIQTEPPREVESFIHRAGRTGRAGKTGVNVLMYSSRQRYALDKIKSANRFAFKTLSSAELEGRKR